MSISGKTGYAKRGNVTNYGSTSTGYSSAGRTFTGVQRDAVKNVSSASTNKKVGFGKEFPMDIFDLKKSGKTVSNISKNVDNPSAKTGVGAQPQGQISSGLSSRLGYNVGDMVSHVKFGKGKVLSIDAATRDYMVTVEFQEYGIKKMLAGFARLKKQ